MAIAFDAATDGGVASSFSHTCTGSNLILFVGVQGDTTDTLSGITYNGVAMTVVNKRQVSGDRFFYLYYLLNPATGAHTVAVSGATFVHAAAASYTGVRQSSQPDASNTNAVVAASSIATSVTTVANNSWTVLFVGTGAFNISAGTGTTSRVLSAANLMLGDSNAAITPAGSTSMTANLSGSGNMASVMASFAPATSALAFDAAANAAAGSSVSPLTYSHTCTGSNRILFVGISWGANSVTGVTYNGVALTKINSRAQSGVNGCELWYLINPASGSNTVSVSFSSSGVDAGSVSYTGALQSGQPDSSGVNGLASGSPLTVSTTVVGANCWTVGIFAPQSGAMGAGTGTTQRVNVSGNIFLGDSNGTVGTGSQSLAITTAGAASAGVVASFLPFVASTVNSGFLAFM